MGSPLGGIHQSPSIFYALAIVASCSTIIPHMFRRQHMQPSLASTGWELESAVERHNQNPSTFWIPPSDQRMSCKPNSRVKLLFLLLGNDDTGTFVQCERMWVMIDSQTDGSYHGRLISQPRTSEALQPGAMITFTADHICDIITE